jgi:hypothetical protein
VRRVFSSFDLGAAHHARNLLQSEGIASLVKNEFLSSGAGELPPAECQIEVWVLDDAQAARAESILRFGAGRGAGPPWRCADCGEALEPQFTQCWRCGAPRRA